MRNYEFHSIDEMGLPCQFIDGKAHHRFGYERTMRDETDQSLLNNVNKCLRWIEQNCEGLNGKFNTHHDCNYWLSIVIEDGKAYLEHGSHGYGYSTAMSLTETAVFSRGSMQSRPYAFSGVQFFPNHHMETFLLEWKTIKSAIIRERDAKRGVRSDEFTA